MTPGRGHAAGAAAAAGKASATASCPTPDRKAAAAATAGRRGAPRIPDQSLELVARPTCSAVGELCRNGGRRRWRRCGASCGLRKEHGLRGALQGEAARPVWGLENNLLTTNAYASEREQAAPLARSAGHEPICEPIQHSKDAFATFPACANWVQGEREALQAQSPLAAQGAGVAEAASWPAWEFGRKPFRGGGEARPAQSASLRDRAVCCGARSGANASQ
eukprot:366268-Chlamydomonas_euryale.AAC.25